MITSKLDMFDNLLVKKIRKKLILTTQTKIHEIISV
jgi:hypothetical protein